MYEYHEHYTGDQWIGLAIAIVICVIVCAWLGTKSK